MQLRSWTFKERLEEGVSLTAAILYSALTYVAVGYAIYLTWFS